MPQIELTGDHTTDRQWLLHLMVFPNDAALRDSTYARAMLEDRLDGLDDSALLTVNAATLRHFLEGHSRAEIKKLQGEAFKRAIFAGYILSSIYLMDRFADVHPKFARPSINKALHACQKFAISPSGKFGDGEKMNWSEQSIRKCWKEFKSVAHLWAAFTLNQQYQFMEPGLPDSAEDLATFLSVASGLYHFGSTFIPKAATPAVPVLSVDDPWMVPSSILPAALKSESVPTLLMQFMDSYERGD